MKEKIINGFEDWASYFIKNTPIINCDNLSRFTYHIYKEGVEDMRNAIAREMGEDIDADWLDDIMDEVIFEQEKMK